MLNQFIGGNGRPGLQQDNGANRLAPLLVREADDCAFRHGGVLDNGMNTSADEYALQAEIGEFVTKTAAKYREMKGEEYEQPARPCHGGA